MADATISRSQADKLGEALRHGEITADLIVRLSAYREQLVRGAKDAAEAIRTLTLYPVTPREGKSTQSIVAKLRRQTIALSRMQDIVGCRIVVDTIVEQEALAARIAGRFSDARLVDRRVEPTFGYRAVHFILNWHHFPYEVQLRSRSQHAWAQTVERLSDRIYRDLKYGKGPEHVMANFLSVSKSIEQLEHIEMEVFRDPDQAMDAEIIAEIAFLRSAIMQRIGSIDPSEGP